MLLALAGVTGVGKSFFKDKIVEKFGFEKIKILTTRQIRNGEKNNIDKIFVTQDELQKYNDEGQIAYQFDMLGNTYAYTKQELFSNKNTVFELHYSTIYDFKKICPKLCAVYIMPNSLDSAKQNTIKRNLSPEVEKQRLQEIDEHYNKITKDKNLLSLFDFVVYNNFDKKSEDEIMSFIGKIIDEGKFN